MENDDRLSWGDSVFLYLEREGMPMNMASVSVLEGHVPTATYRRFIESRLPLVPRYLKRVLIPPLHLGLPSWDYDPEFDIKNHVRAVTLKRGTMAELKALAGRLFSKNMDRRHPLWDMTLVHGLRGNRTALIARLHHCLADGIAGVGLMNVMMDPMPEITKVPRARPLRVPKPGQHKYSMVDGVLDTYSHLFERVFSMYADLIRLAEHSLATGGTRTSDELAGFWPELTAPTERLPMNVIYRGPQKFAFTEVPLAEVKAIKERAGAHVNDVLLALITATMRRYSERHGENVKGRLLRMMVPVNVRTNGDAGLGNHISLVPVTVPLDIRPPKALLAAVHKRTEFLKRVNAAEMVGVAGGFAGVLPTSLLAFTGQLLPQLPITPFNMVCTNVPGPQFPLYVLGHKMLSWYPYVPIGGELALNCAVLSYNGAVYFGFSGEVHAAPDLSRLERLLQENFRELCAATGVRVSRAKAKTKAKRKRTRTIANVGAKAATATPPVVEAPTEVPPTQEPAKIDVAVPIPGAAAAPAAAPDARRAKAASARAIA
jgi:diacylglycerol O-acyltransferase / wax synthase